MATFIGFGSEQAASANLDVKTLEGLRQYVSTYKAAQQRQEVWGLLPSTGSAATMQSRSLRSSMLVRSMPAFSSRLSTGP